MTAAAVKKDLRIIRDRLGAPYRPEPKIDGRSAARHHVVPYYQMVDFWNKVIQHPTHYTYVKSLTDAIAKNLPSHYATNFSQLQINDLTKILPEFPGYVHDTGADEPGKGSEWGDFSQLLPWLPGNIFIGPQDQFRDNPPPEGKLEPKACSTIVGVKRYDTLRSMDENITTYLATPAQATAQAVFEALATDLAGPCGVFAFRDTQWVKGANGKWSITEGKSAPPRPDGKKIRVRGHIDVELEF